MALQTQRCDQNMQQNNLRFLHRTVTHALPHEIPGSLG